MDGLRALACLLILIHHTISGRFSRLLDAYLGGHTGFYWSSFTQSGVEMFFLLSGILLLRPYLNGDRQLDVPVYYKRRFTRIYTPYFFAVLFGGMVIWINTAYPTWYSSVLIYFSVPGFLSQFLLFNFKGDYYNLAWWSLQVEVLFYLIIPFLILPLKRWSFRVSVTVTLFVMLVLQIMLKTSAPSMYSVEVIYLNPLRIVDYALCFLLGCFLARDQFSQKEAYLAWGAAAVFLLMAPYYHPALHVGYAFLYFGFIILVLNNSFGLQAILSKPLLVWIGERSYSLFLIHFSVLYLVNYMTSYIVDDRSVVYAFITRIGGVMFSFLASMVLFYFVERKQAKGLQTADQFWPPIFSRKK